MFVEPNIPMPLTEDTYETMVSSWLKIIRFHESGVVHFLPKTDRLRRINQLIFDKDIQAKYVSHYRKLRFLILNPDMVFFDDEEEFKNFILSQFEEKPQGDLKTVIETLSKNYHLVFFIVNAEKLFLENKEDYLAVLALQQTYNPSVSILLFSETDLTHPKFLPLLSKYTVFCQNILFAPLYLKKHDLERFVVYCEKKWQISISEEIRTQICTHCKHLWFLKEAARYVRDNEKANLDDILNHESLKLKLSIFFQNLLPSEQQVLKKAALKQAITSLEEKHSLHYLEQMKLVQLEKLSFAITIPVLEMYINRYLSQNDLLLVNDQLILNGVTITDLFSAKEQAIVMFFIRNQNRIIKRDEIAEIIWGKNYFDEYSDWTIDQSISRLRRKLAKVGISPLTLKTLKKQGFLFKGSDL